MSDRTHVRIDIPGDHLPLYWTRRGKTRPAHLAIDCEKQVASWGFAPYDGRPLEVWRGRTYWVECSPYLTTDRLAELSTRGQPLVDRVVAGYTAGQNPYGDLVGRLDRDATRALATLEALLAAEGRGVTVMTVEEWCARFDVDALLAHERTLQDATRALIDRARECGVEFEEDFNTVYDYLEALADAADDAYDEYDEDEADEADF